MDTAYERHKNQEGSLSTIQLSLATQVCGISWHQIFPVLLNDGAVRVELTSYHEVYRFIGEKMAKLPRATGSSEKFLLEGLTSEKEKFLLYAADCFSFKDKNDQIIGVFLGNLHDWSTYYMRYMGLLPEYQGRGIYKEFVRILCDFLPKSSIKRIETHVAPSNLPCISAQNSLGFHVTGTLLTDRWGALLLFTKYVSNTSEEIFLNQFCSEGSASHKTGLLLKNLTKKGGSK